MRSFAVAGLVLAMSFAAVAARADCAPVLAAYGKAEASKRYAIYESDGLAETAPKGKPFTVVVGGQQYTKHYDRKGPLEIVENGYDRGGMSAAGEADMLRTKEQSGKSTCASIGERQVAGEAAQGWRIREQGRPAFMAIELWVSRASGLPLFHRMGDTGGGFRWAYGERVVAPAGVR